MTYEDRFADRYDLFYEDKDYETEAQFVDRCLKQYSSTRPQKLLELACGTGRHAVEMSKLGYEVVATDISPDMLAHARKRPGAESVTFIEQDMRALDVAQGPFDAVMCLFDSIGHVARNDAICSTLQGIARHLRDDGLFVFEFWHGAAVAKSFERFRDREWSEGGSRVVRTSETTIDWVSQTATVRYKLVEYEAGGSTESEDTITNRFFLVQEAAAFLMQAGLEPQAWLAGFAEDSAIDEDTWHIVCVARKEASAAV